MTKRIGVLVTLLLLAGGSLASLADDGDASGFGFGGGGISALFPDLAGVNAFLSENGLPPMPEFLVGGVGGGRGGVIGGPSFGGMGFGVAATSTNENGSADLAIGAGGFDIGFAIGGDESSVLTVGAVLGGGASVLDLSFPGVQPAGIVPEPAGRAIGRAFAMAMPYVSFEAQLAGFFGLGVRIGYFLPVVGFDFEDGIGIPAPSLDLSGPFVGVSIEFGGIARVGGPSAATKQATAAGSLELAGAAAKLTVENGTGDIVVSSYPYSAAQTDSLRVVEWSAVCDEEGADGASLVEAKTGPDGASLRTAGDRHVDYVLRIPAGTDLDLVNGAGAIHVVGHTAAAVRVSLGVGEMSLAGMNVGDLSLSVGVGEIAVQAEAIGSMSAHAGIGRMQIFLPPDLSASISTSAGLGETSIDGFAVMTLAEHGFLWTGATDAVLGTGAAECSLSVGIGEIEVRATKPVSSTTKPVSP
jgi:hypothetical protein